MNHWNGSHSCLSWCRIILVVTVWCWRLVSLSPHLLAPLSLPLPLWQQLGNKQKSNIVETIGIRLHSTWSGQLTALTACRLKIVCVCWGGGSMEFITLMLQPLSQNCRWLFCFSYHLDWKLKTEFVEGNAYIRCCRLPHLMWWIVIKSWVCSRVCKFWE